MHLLCHEEKIDDNDVARVRAPRGDRRGRYFAPFTQGRLVTLFFNGQHLPIVILISPLPGPKKKNKFTERLIIKFWECSVRLLEFKVF